MRVDRQYHTWKLLLALVLSYCISHPALAQSVGGFISGTDVTDVVKKTSTSVISWFIYAAVAVAVGGLVFLVAALMMGEDRFPKQKALNWFYAVLALSIGIFIIGKVYTGLGTTATAFVGAAGGNTTDGGS